MAESYTADALRSRSSAPRASNVSTAVIASDSAAENECQRFALRWWCAHVGRLPHKAGTGVASGSTAESGKSHVREIADVLSLSWSRGSSAKLVTPHY